MKSSFMKVLLAVPILAAVLAIIISCNNVNTGPPCVLSCCPVCMAPEFLIVTTLNQVLSFSADTNTGVPTKLGSVAGPNASGGMVTTGPNFVYVSDPTGNMVDGFVSNGGNLTPIPGSPFPGVTGPGGLTDNGKFLFVPNFNGNSVSVFSIGQNGALTAVPGSPFPAASGPRAAAFDFTHFLYVSNFTDTMGGISGYAVDPNTGALTPLPGSPFATKLNAGPAGMVAISGNGTSFLFVALTNDNSVAAFAIDRTSGALTLVPGSPFGTGSGPLDLAANGGSFLYTADGNANTVTGFAIASNGALTPIPGSPFPAGTAPSRVAVDSFLHVYVTNNASNNISGFTITPASGALAPLTGSPFNAGTQPTSIAVGH